MATSDQQAAPRCRFGTFELNLQSGELTRDGRPVKLQPQPARVLILLVSRAGELVPREDLKTHLWGEDTFVDFERGLNFCIQQVRTALADQSDNPRFIQTVPRRGYRFIAPVAPQMTPQMAPQMTQLTPQMTRMTQMTRKEPVDDVAAAAPAVASSSPSLSSAPSVSSVSSVSSVAVAVLLILGLSAAVAGLLRREEAPSAARLRVAVLPVTNLTGNPEADYLADGLTDELIAQLGRLNPKRLGVISRTSVLAYRSGVRSVADIGRDLDVGYVLEASLRLDDGRVRVTSELVSTADQTQIWAETFERPAGDAMRLQTDVGARIARALAIELVPGTAGPGLPPPTRDADAWDLYLRGRQVMNRGTPADVADAVRLFEAAVARDPAFAAGWAQIAEAQHLLVMLGSRAPLDAYPPAADAARRALALDPGLADAHVATGLVRLWFDWSPGAAATSFERALALNGSHGAAHHDYAWALVGLGRFDEAVAHITMARDLDPLSVRANADIGWMRLHLRQPTEATRACAHTLAIQPESLEAQACLERAYLQRGLIAEAVRAARATQPARADRVAASGAPIDELRAIWQWRLGRLEQASASRWASPYTMATLLVALDRPDEALARLDEAREQRIGVMGFLATDPALDPLRRDPRFQAIVDRVNESAR